MTEEIALIQGIGFGYRDANEPCLWFELWSLHHRGFRCLIGEDINHFLKVADVYNINELEGTTCVIEANSDGIVEFKRRWP